MKLFSKAAGDLVEFHTLEGLARHTKGPLCRRALSDHSPLAGGPDVKAWPHSCREGAGIEGQLEYLFSMSFRTAVSQNLILVLPHSQCLRPLLKSVVQRRMTTTRGGLASGSFQPWLGYCGGSTHPGPNPNPRSCFTAAVFVLIPFPPTCFTAAVFVFAADPPALNTRECLLGTKQALT